MYNYHVNLELHVRFLILCSVPVLHGLIPWGGGGAGGGELVEEISTQVWDGKTMGLLGAAVNL